MFIQDNIHGLIEISELAKSIIDTPYFQRLRRICQLGLSYKVFPSGNHTRFEHSIGVYHLAKVFSKNLVKDLEYSKKFKTRLCELIGIGGLVHDIGHLAFSHLFENFLNSKNINFSHEKLSERVFDKICEEYKIKLSKNEIYFIKTLINPPDNWNEGFLLSDVKIGGWVYQIICNKENGLDVDKFDYLTRDSISCGINISFNFDRIIKMAKIVDNEIVFPWKLRHDIFDMYLSRYQLHCKIYHHKTVLSMEILIKKILSEIYLDVDFDKKINELDILDITDNIIYNYSNKNIKEILYRIDTRKIPKITDFKDAINKNKIVIKNGLSSGDNNPLNKIKYLKNDKIVYANIKDYGILASKDYFNTITFYSSE